ncbi:MAG: 23S rRNA (guanosine(2251)-2'-O)-methyltransferase RlmB [Mariprofundaceae bacterium]
MYHIGIHAVKHALQSDTIDELFIEKDKHHPRIDDLIHLAKKQNIQIHFESRITLDKQCNSSKHQGVVALSSPRNQQQPTFKAWLQTLEIEASPLILLLDQVTDPHNLGACIRTAEAAGCRAVIIPKDHAADLTSPAVVKSACGALSHIPIITVTNLVQCMKKLKDKGFWLYGLAGEVDQSLYQTEFSGAIAIVMGAEGTGLRPLVANTCDQLLKIPMPGKIESLNVSVATGISLFEVVRQQ